MSSYWPCNGRRREPRHRQRGWHSARDVQGHPQEDPGHAAVSAESRLGQLRPDTQRVLLRPAPGRLRSGRVFLFIYLFIYYKIVH